MCLGSCVSPQASPRSARCRDSSLAGDKLSRAEQGLHTSAQDVLQYIVCVFSQTQAYRDVARLGQELPHRLLGSRLLSWCSVVPQARTPSTVAKAPLPRQGRRHLVIRPHRGFLVVPTASFVVTRPSPGPHMALSLPVGSDIPWLFPDCCDPDTFEGSGPVSPYKVPPRGCPRQGLMPAMPLWQGNHRSDVWYRVVSGAGPHGVPFDRSVSYLGAQQHLRWELTLLPSVMNGNLVGGNTKLCR